MYAVLSMFDYNWKQQRNNKTTKTSQPLNKNKNLKQCKQANKKTKNKNKKRTKKQDSWQKSLDQKIIYFLQLLTDIAFNPRPGSCCNAQRYGNDESG